MNFGKIRPLIIFGFCYLTCLVSQIYADDDSTLCVVEQETLIDGSEEENV